MRSVFPSLIVVFLLLIPLSAQEKARIWGTVTDTTGGVLPGVNVTVTNVETGLTRTYVSDERGRFIFTEMEPGHYHVKAELPAFKTFVGTDVILRVADSVEVPVQMEIGEITETITVSSAAKLLETTTSSLGDVVENKLIDDLPLNGRNTLSLVTLIPGVIPNRQMESAAQPFNRAGNFAISGGRGVTNEIMLDGTPNTVAEGSTGAFTAVTAFTPVDATREFKVQTNAYSADLGRSGGGVVNIVTKSGTNELHGSVFWFHRNSAMDANDFFNNKNNIELASFKRNQFGVAVGGPIYFPGLYNGKDRSFFFVSWESLVERSGWLVQDSVPTEKEKVGDFSETYNAAGELVTIYDPLSTIFDPETQTYVRTPFPGNRIPQDRIDPVMKKVFEFWPDPTGPGARYTHAQNFLRSLARPINDHKFDVRIDHQVTEKDSLFGRVSIGRRDWNLPNVYGNIADRYARTYPSDPTSIKLGNTYTVSEHYLLDFRYAYNYLYFAQEPASVGYDFTDLGLPQYLYEMSQNPEFPRFTFSGYGSFGHSSNTMWGRQETHIFMGSMSRVKGSHAIKAGYDTRMSRIGRFVNWGPAGYFTFSRSFTQGPNALQASTSAGNSLASALLGNASNRIFRFASVPSVQNWYAAFYFQDDWKISPKLTLNLGLRYDLELPMTERFNNISWADPNVQSPIDSLVPELDLKGAVFYADDDQRTVPFNLDKNNFAPRIGLAYELNDFIVIRTGYGVFYAPHPNGISDNTGFGFSSTTYSATTFDGVTPVGTMSDPFFDGFVPVLGRDGGPETQIGQGISFWEFNSRTPYNQQWNLNIQTRMGQNILLDVAYLGSKGTHLPDRIGVNQLRAEELGPEVIEAVPNPFFGVITQGALAGPTIPRRQLMVPYPQYTSASLQFPTAASSIYHAFQFKANKRFSSGLTFLVSYTAGKLIDDASGLMSWLEPATGHQDIYNRRADRAVSDQDVAQRFVTSFSFALPFGRNKSYGSNWSPVLDYILGGWQTNGILTLQSGIPLSLTTTNTSFANNAVLRPNTTGQSARKEGGTIDERLNEWFKTNTFSQPALFTFGNVGRNLPDVRGPGLTNVDFSIFKNISFGEGRYVQIRGEFFNLTNTPEFDNPVTGFQSTSFGRILSQRNRPRQIQIGLRIVF